MIKIDKDFKGDVWVTSDTHYNHANICRGTTSWRKPDGSVPINETRDFKNLDLMNDTIVNNINSIVKEDDIIHKLLSSISKDRVLMQWKHKTKLNIFAKAVKGKYRTDCENHHF